jgi:hypothetical protein
MTREGMEEPMNDASMGTRRTAITLTCLAGLLAVLLAIVPRSAEAAFGDAFSFAPTTVDPGGLMESTAPAFPGETAFWAGVCDLHAGASATVALPPTDGRHAGCIDQPASLNTTASGTQMAPPLAIGVASTVLPGESDIDPNYTSGVNGWLRRDNLLLPVTGPSWRLTDITQAGARPDGSASFWFSRAPGRPTGLAVGQAFGPDGQPRDIRVSLPPGVVGNPNALPKCPATALNTSPSTCPPKTQVGVSTVAIGHVTAVYPVYNVEARTGKTAEFVISGVGLDNSYKTNAPVVASARTNEDFGIDALATDVPSAVGLHGQTFTFWGVPWAKSHDRYRPVAGYCGAAQDTDNENVGFGGGMATGGLAGGFARGCSQEPQSYDPSWGPIKPFFATQTECSPTQPVTKIWADNWHTTKIACSSMRVCCST